jgi:hypothetical protein
MDMTDTLGGNLLPDEEIEFYTRPHWMTLLPNTLASLAFVVFGFGLLNAERLGPESALILKVAMMSALAANCYMYWVFSNTSFVVTNRRVVTFRGQGYQTTSMEVLLSKTESIQMQQPLLGSMFGYGTLTLSGTGGTKEIFPGVVNPQEFRRAVQEQIEAASAPPAPEPTARALG